MNELLCGHSLSPPPPPPTSHLMIPFNLYLTLSWTSRAVWFMWYLIVATWMPPCTQTHTKCFRLLVVYFQSYKYLLLFLMFLIIGDFGKLSCDPWGSTLLCWRCGEAMLGYSQNELLISIRTKFIADLLLMSTNVSSRSPFYMRVWCIYLLCLYPTRPPVYVETIPEIISAPAEQIGITSQSTEVVCAVSNNTKTVEWSDDKNRPYATRALDSPITGNATHLCGRVRGGATKGRR